MKTETSHHFALLFAFLALFTLSQAFLCTQDMYSEYLTHWNRNFTAQKALPQYSTRLNDYCNNRKYVENINSQNLSYTLDIFWQWMDRSDAQRNDLVKVSFNPQSMADAATPIEEVENLRKVSGTVPYSVDYRISGDVSSVKNQGTCGACWTFTTVGTYESWMMLKGQQEYDLSQEYLLQCTTKFTENVKHEDYESDCKGGYIQYAGELARLNGLPLETKFPYAGSTFTGSGTPETPGICDANETIMYAKDPAQTKFVVSKNNTNTKMKELIAQGPVAAMIYADAGFQAYKSGIYTGCPTCSTCSFDLINHAVVIIGYDIYGNYIVKNSWGTAWGMSGYGIVSKDTDCALSAYAYQYMSDAAPGGGVLFYNQTKLNSGNQLLSSILLVLFLSVLLN